MGQPDFTGPGDERSFRAIACHCCKKYIKEIYIPRDVSKLQLDANFMGSHALDHLAREQGFKQESPLIVEADDTSAEGRLLAHRMRMPWDNSLH